MKQLNWYQIFGKSNIPDGRTVLPTDDIQIWLNCADIWDKTYTTLAEVLADTTTLLALINSPNAVDYMVRSTTWAVAQALVPKMTSDTTPSGEAFANPENNTYLAFKCFAQDNSLFSKVANNVGSYIGYDFNHPVSISKTLFRGGYSLGSTFKIQGYKNNEWVDITSFVSEAPNQDARPSSYQIISSPCDNIEKVRLYQNTKVSSVSNNCDYWELQFYSASITDNAIAMSYIGLNNYCANTLLADSTWLNAICNSEYFESVLNVKVPTMTSNTTPSGECSASTIFDATYPAWKAFDGNNTSLWNSTKALSNQWVRYKFTSAHKIYVVVYKGVCDGTAFSTNVSFKFRHSADGLSWQDTTSVLGGGTNNSGKEIISADTSNSMYFECLQTSGTAGLSAKEIQFYGREDV